MRLGIVLPSFSPDAEEARSVALVCERAGIHGVFCFDHLWPLGEPGSPAISPYPLLGALSQVTTSITLGTLVARVGLVPDRVLVSELCTLHELCDGRFIAALGTGDHKSAPENAAFGIEFADAAIRRAQLFRVATSLRERDVTVWIGGGARATNEEASLTGATLNLWGASIAKVQAASLDGPVSWAGRFPTADDEAARQLVALREAGATWAVYIWPGSIAAVVNAAHEGDVALGD